jgi:hypothetical protein
VKSDRVVADQTETFHASPRRINPELIIPSRIRSRLIASAKARGRVWSREIA